MMVRLWFENRQFSEISSYKKIQPNNDEALVANYTIQ